MLPFLDILFFVFHTALIGFNLLGWLWHKTRLANLISLALTALSWSVLGIWYGFGYCPCTDWHWQVRMKMGLHDMPSSYLKFLVDSLTGLDVNPQWVDVGALVGLILAIVGSCVTNYRDRRGS